MLAAKSGKTDLVTSLLEFDAKVDDKDVTGNSAADYANGKKKVRYKVISEVCKCKSYCFLKSLFL